MLVSVVIAQLLLAAAPLCPFLPIHTQIQAANCAAGFARQQGAQKLCVHCSTCLWLWIEAILGVGFSKTSWKLEGLGTLH